MRRPRIPRPTRTDVDARFRRESLPEAARTHEVPAFPLPMSEPTAGPSETLASCVTATLNDAARFGSTAIVILATTDPSAVRTWRRASRAGLIVIAPGGSADEAKQRAALLDAGADVCLTNPDAAELDAHVRSLQRRLHGPEPAEGVGLVGLARSTGSPA